jgi:hypothetical protein
MELKISLSCFLHHLRKAKQFDREHPELHQVEWLLTNFRCDDKTAIFDPPPIVLNPVWFWLMLHARN